MAGQLGEADRRRLAREGFGLIGDEMGLALLDAADAAAGALLVPVPLDLARLRDRGQDLPPVLSGLVRRAGRRTVGAVDPAGASGRSGLAARLAALPEADRDAAVREVVLAQAALVLGMAGPQAVDASGPAVLPRAWLRLADRGRAAEPAQSRHRASVARHAGVRLPDAGSAGRVRPGRAAR